MAVVRFGDVLVGSAAMRREGRVMGRSLNGVSTDYSNYVTELSRVCSRCVRNGGRVHSVGVRFGKRCLHKSVSGKRGEDYPVWDGSAPLLAFARSLLVR